MLHVCLLLLSLAVQDDPKPLPALQPFLAELRKTLHSDNLLLSEYTYTEKRTSIQLDSGGKSKKTDVDVYQVFPGSPQRPGYRRQIVKNGMPLTAQELAKQDEEHKKRVDQRNKRTAEEREKRRAKARAEDDKIMDDIFGLYDIQMVGRDKIAEHPTILLFFKPRPNYKPKTSDGKIMQHIAGRAWVSEDDHQLARLEMDAVDTISIGFGILARLNKGSHISAERHKFNDEVWLPARVEAVMNARVLLLKGFNVRQVVEYSDHRKFSVDTILSFPDVEPQPQP
jgi:hypothetical protein